MNTEAPIPTVADPSGSPDQKIAVPALAFGHARAIDHLDAGALSEAYSQDGPVRVDYAPSDPDRPFRSLTSVVRTQNMRIVANSMTASRSRCSGGDEKGGMFLIPLQGSGVTRLEGRLLDWSEGRHAAFITGAPSEGESTERSAIGVHVSPTLLGELARTMSGPEAKGRPLPFALSEPRRLDLAIGGVRFDQLFRQHFALLQAIGVDGTAASRTGVEDMILRSLVIMSAPDLFLGDGPAPLQPLRRDLADLCDYIDAHLDRTITLSDLEARSHLSTRGLQYAFRSAFGCSPMQWVSERRLEKVRQRLLAAEGNSTVSSLAAGYFHHLGDFSRRYKRRYGERPSETLTRRKKG